MAALHKSEFVKNCGVFLYRSSSCASKLQQIFRQNLHPTAKMALARGTTSVQPRELPVQGWIQRWEKWLTDRPILRWASYLNKPNWVIYTDKSSKGKKHCWPGRASMGTQWAFPCFSSPRDAWRWTSSKANGKTDYLFRPTTEPGLWREDGLQLFRKAETATIKPISRALFIVGKINLYSLSFIKPPQSHNQSPEVYISPNYTIKWPQQFPMKV